MNLLARQLRVSAIEAEVTRFQRFARDAPIGILFISSDATVQFAATSIRIRNSAMSCCPNS